MLHQNPLFQPDTASPSLLLPLGDVLEQLVLQPLKASPDPDTWLGRLKQLLPEWRRLRAFGSVLLLHELGSRQEITHLNEEARRIPLTLLEEPAAGAAVFARDVLLWLSHESLHHDWQNVGVYALEELVQRIMVIELCWFTLLRVAPPQGEVAREAAWEAYARARRIRVLAPSLGLNTDTFPAEDPLQAGLRAKEMVRRLAAAWVEGTDEG